MIDLILATFIYGVILSPALIITRVSHLIMVEVFIEITKLKRTTALY
jgi:hypothetical protein